MPAQGNNYPTIRAEGALLTAELLQRIGGDEGLAGRDAASYGHPERRLNELISNSWNALQGPWARYQAAREDLRPGDAGIGLTRERWLLPLFTELEYRKLRTATAVEIEGRSYAISHRGDGIAMHLLGHGVPLDLRSRGVAGAAGGSPHSLMQRFLNLSDGQLWGFLSNGHRLRLLRDSLRLTRQAYIEFDLYAMMEGEHYSDFALFWLLCHRTRAQARDGRPEECWLEKWREEAAAQGMRALDQLRGGVERAIIVFGGGFLAHPANGELRQKLDSGALEGREYYRQLLRLVYRLLFLFVAEDRELLHPPRPEAPEAEAGAAQRNAYEKARADHDAKRALWKNYSTQRLRSLAAEIRGTEHEDLYELLKLVMALLGDEREIAAEDKPAWLLGFSPPGSRLFREDALDALNDCRLGNRALLEALRALSQIDDPRAQALRSIDYRQLGPEELGSVYESLLELHPRIELAGRRFALATAGGHERKTTGSYYTPRELVEALLDSALEPLLEEARQADDPARAILALRACDAACGSGHFLLAAAERMARALATARSDEPEPSPAALQEARRDVVGQCLYGVDSNPMAVELCKINLWQFSLLPGKPLSLLEHRIRVGDSLLGATPALLAEGIPDEAFAYLAGDESKAAVSTLRKVNRRQKRAFKYDQKELFEEEQAEARARQAAAFGWAARRREDDFREQHGKERVYEKLAATAEMRQAWLLADAWCAAFVEEKRGSEELPLTERVWRLLEERPEAPEFEGLRERVAALRERYGFFHWHLAFPEIFNRGRGGFDVVLGNVPWDQIQLDAREFFAQRDPTVANARNMTERNRMIRRLAETKPGLHADYHAEKRSNDSVKHFIHASGRFPLTSFGRLNKAPLFAELNLHLINERGRVGMILPSGIATDSFNQHFFRHVFESGALRDFYDLENREKLFPDVDSRMKFALMTMQSPDAGGEASANFAFFLRHPRELKDPARRFTLRAEDIKLLNPNTLTAPVFRTREDAELAKAIYRRVPVLIDEGQAVRRGEVSPGNPWGLRFMLMFMMNTDSNLFRTREQLEAQGYVLVGNRFVQPDRLSADSRPEAGGRRPEAGGRRPEAGG